MDQPTRNNILKMVSENMYGQRILNNAHRGDVVEMMVLSALGSDWKLVGLGWHPWDLQRGHGENRVRIQVKHSAALQLWGPTKKQILTFGWKKNPPEYFFEHNPGEAIEPEGWFCDVFVIGLHLESDIKKADQVDTGQWDFLVIPISDLKRGQNSMVLSVALERWETVSWLQLSKAVEEATEQHFRL